MWASIVGQDWKDGPVFDGLYQLLKQQLHNPVLFDFNFQTPFGPSKDSWPSLKKQKKLKIHDPP